MATLTRAPAPARARLRLTRTRAALLGIVALAIVLRVIGLRFGLPAVYNPDEVAIMSRALAFAKGDLNPHNFLYPTFYFYVLFVWIGLSFLVSWLAGIVSSLAAFQTQFFVDPTNIYLAGRLLGVACGTATVALAYVLGRRLLDSRTGLTAALFLAVAPGHVRDSHYVKHDVPATLAILLAQLAMLRLLTDTRPGASANASPRQPAVRCPAPSQFVVAGAACGLACSTHYYAVFLALPLLLAIYLATAAQGWRVTLTRTAQAGIAAAAVFFALSPFLLIEPRTALQDIIANRQIVVDRAVSGSHVLFGNAGTYLRMLWTEDLRWPICLGAAAGALTLLREQPRVAAVLLAFPIAFLLFISNTVAASRYLNPVLPTCAALAAYAVMRLAAIATARRTKRPEPQRRVATAGAGAAAIAWTAAIAMSVPALILSVRLDYFFRQTDTRTLAQRYVEQTVPPGATVLIQPYSVPLTQSRESLTEALQAHLGDLRRTPPPPKFALRLALTPYPAPAYRTLYLGEGGMDQDKIYLSYRDASDPDLATLRQAGVRYIVLKRYNVVDPAVEPLRAVLAREGRLLTTISPYGAKADEATRARVAPFLHNTDTPYDPALERPGPGIEVWQVP